MKRAPWAPIPEHILAAIVGDYEARGGEWPEHAALADLVLWVRRCTRPSLPETYPGQVALAERWGWVTASGRPARKRVRRLLASEAYLDPRDAGAWYEAAGVEKGHARATEGPRKGHARATQGPPRNLSTSDIGDERATRGPREGHARATEGPREGYARGKQQPSTLDPQPSTLDSSGADPQDVVDAWTAQVAGLQPLDLPMPMVQAIHGGCERLGTEQAARYVAYVAAGATPDARWRAANPRLAWDDRRLASAMGAVRAWEASTQQPAGASGEAVWRELMQRVQWRAPSSGHCPKMLERHLDDPQAWWMAEDRSEHERRVEAMKRAGGWNAWKAIYNGGHDIERQRFKREFIAAYDAQQVAA